MDFSKIYESELAGTEDIIDDLRANKITGYDAARMIQDRTGVSKADANRIIGRATANASGYEFQEAAKKPDWPITNSFDPYIPDNVKNLIQGNENLGRKLARELKEYMDENNLPVGDEKQAWHIGRCILIALMDGRDHLNSSEKRQVESPKKGHAYVDLLDMPQLFKFTMSFLKREVRNKTISESIYDDAFSTKDGGSFSSLEIKEMYRNELRHANTPDEAINFINEFTGIDKATIKTIVQEKMSLKRAKAIVESMGFQLIREYTEADAEEAHRSGSFDDCKKSHPQWNDDQIMRFLTMAKKDCSLALSSY